MWSIIKVFHALWYLKIEMGIAGLVFNLHLPNFQKMCIFWRCKNYIRNILFFMVSILKRMPKPSSPTYHSLWPVLQVIFLYPDLYANKTWYVLSIRIMILNLVYYFELCTYLLSWWLWLNKNMKGKNEFRCSLFDELMKDIYSS